MARIIVFTDIHFNADKTANGETPFPDPVERLNEGLSHVAKHAGKIDRLIITGDLTHRGDVGSYELLKQTLGQHDLPISLMIGNHDNRENFLSVFNNSGMDENGHVQQVIDIENHRLVLLDTLYAPPYNYPESHMGFLCDKRLSWLDKQLETAGGRKCVIFMHHHPHAVGFRAMDTIKLLNADAFYSLLEKHGNVKHISCGHVHRTISGNHRGISFSLFKSIVGQMPMMFDTMDFHMETDTEPAAYGILDLHEEGITVHTEDYGLTDLSQYGD